MKKILALTLLIAASSAHSSVLCQSMKDPTFRAWFEGYSCPSGYYMIRMG